MRISFRRNFVLALVAAACIAPAAAKGDDKAGASLGFRDGVTPTDVFSRVDLLDREIDVILEAKNIAPPPRPKILETQLGPMHAYQIHIACIRRLHDFERQAGLTPIPLIVSRPMKYTPADVKWLSDLLLVDLRKTAAKLQIDGLPKQEQSFTGKTPTDVFQRTVTLFSKLSALAGHEKITPNEAYAEMVCAVGDVKSILAQMDPACRYNIETPASKAGLTPGDVFTNCLAARKAVNQVRRTLKLGITPVPEIPEGYQLTPVDVFVQTQILIAELNLLKLATDTTSSTLLAVPVTGKTPTDVHQQANVIKHLVAQIITVRKRTTAARSARGTRKR